MKPDFALSLSFDGITFMCRLEEGWHQLGKVPLEHADLDGALADLRRLGEDHAGGDALCKVILPNDQIRYLTIEKTEIDTSIAARSALEGATPYAIDELAYDVVENGDLIQIAAVAKETLAEAEEFATEHGFHPVSFVGVPDKTTFSGEPFFGPTALAASLVEDLDTLEPEEAAIVVISEGPLPEKAQEAPKPLPSFATSRAIEDEAAPAPSLPGAEKTTDQNTPPKLVGVTNGAIQDPPAPSGAQVGQQEARINPATLIAGLKPRPKPSNPSRARGASRNKTSDKAAATAASQPVENKPKGFGVTPAKQEIGGKPKHLGLILIVALLAFMALVAVWASLFGSETTAKLFGKSDEVEQIALLTDPNSSIGPNGDLIDSAEIEALDDNEGILIDPVLEAAEPALSSQAFYAATGIWDRAPGQPGAPNQETTDGIYLSSFETSQETHDAIALPSPQSFAQDFVISDQNNPVAAGITIDLDERGLVIATAEGSISPEGVVVFLGKPPAVPADFPTRSFAQTDEVAPEETANALLAQFRPTARPSNLTEQNQRANLGGSTLSELAQYRPRLRPEDLVQVASIDPAAIAQATNDAVQALAQADALEAARAAEDAANAEASVESGTAQAVVASLKPQARPRNFARTIARQQEQQASVAVPQAARVTPSIPTTASVARNATQQNAISLRQVNLIGVYGASSDRRALVRLSSGRYRKVKVGDRIDGGRVAAISTSELRYVKNNRSVVLKMPNG